MFPPEMAIPFILIGFAVLAWAIWPQKVMGLFARLPTRLATPAIGFLDTASAKLESAGFQSDISKLPRDAWVMNAISFLALGSWDFDVVENSMDHEIALLRATHKIQEAAADGHIPIWGMNPLLRRYAFLDSATWNYLGIKENSLSRRDPEQVYARRKHLWGPPERYDALKTNKARVEAWHAANTCP